MADPITIPARRGKAAFVNRGKPSPSSTPTVNRSSILGLSTATTYRNSCRWSTAAPRIVT